MASRPIGRRARRRSSSPLRATSAALTVALVLGIDPSSLSPSAARAQVTTEWVFGTGDWFDPGNWDAGVPGAADTAIVDNGGTARVDLPGAEASELVVGEIDTGTLIVGPGGTVENEWTVLGSCACAQGTIVVRGASSSLTSDTGLFVGAEGSGTLRVEDGGTVYSESGIIAELAGSTGAVTVTGAGSTWTTGPFSVLYVGQSGTGTLTVEDGGAVEAQTSTVIGSAVGAEGTAVVRGAGSTLTVANGLIVGFAGGGSLTIAGGGRLSVDSGTGTIVLASQAGSTGTLDIGEGGAAGILDIDHIQSDDGTATINFNHNETAYVFENASGAPVTISGSAALNFLGPGTTILMSTQSYTGATTISAGTLRVDGSIADSTTTVNAGGTLAGTGTVGNVLFGGGTIAPGRSIGTITVDGDVDFSGGGTYAVEVDAAGNADLIDATGTAALTGGSVRVIPLLGVYGEQTDYTILTAADPITTTFDGVSTSSAFLTPELTYGANAVTLRLSRNATAFADVAETGNQTGVAGALDAAANGATGDMGTLIGALLSLSADEAQAAFDQLSGTTTTGPAFVHLADHAQFAATLRVNTHRPGGMPSGAAAGNFAPRSLALADHAELGSLLGELGPALSAAPDRSAREFSGWISGYGIAGRVRGDGNAGGFVHRTGGAMAGVDWDVSEETTLGVALGYSRSTIDSSGSDDTGETETWRLSLYGTHRPETREGRLTLDGALGVGRLEQTTKRRIAFGGLDRTARGDTKGYELWGHAGAGWRLEAGDTRVTPRGELGFSRIHHGAFTETGAGAANLTMASRDIDSLHSRLGVAVERRFETADGTVWRPAALAGWRHEFADTARRGEAALAGLPANRFEVTGVAAARDRLELGAGLSAETPGGTGVTLDYAAGLGGREATHGVFLRIARPL